ncbi:substrate-binding periplasmic protein [Saccharospirillum salsuginis]|uniref:substrate-binding periplasmic protein n=1 Tax=Saccharospirillum salsuginis TaxID=418750 RepID=UPI001676F0E1|nr:transporter substrate-binding domain-containing protein [Saccharospirillum salsuginis]
MSWLRPVGLVVLLALCFGVAQVAADEKRVRVATLGDYPPYCFYKEGVPPKSHEVVPPGSDAESFQGYSWDILRESFHARGYTIELVITPWVRAMANVREGDADLLFPAGKNSEREAYFTYPRVPINDAAFRIYVNPDSSIEWTDLSSLDGLTIGLVRGYNFGDDWAHQNEIEKYPLNTIEQGFRMLASNRLDGFAGYETNWDYVLKEMGQQGRFEKLPVFGSSREYVVGLTSNPATDTLLREFEAGLATIQDTGEFQRIVERWR